MLRIAAGLTEATSGTVAGAREQLGFVFQDATLLPWRTVQGNTELLLELHGVPRSEREERAAEAIAAVGLVGFEHHHPKQLSGGMKMRASLARWLTLEPSVFLFDEPFGALDEITRERLNEELLHLFQERGFAGVFVTHSLHPPARPRHPCRVDRYLGARQHGTDQPPTAVPLADTGHGGARWPAQQHHNAPDRDELVVDHPAVAVRVGGGHRLRADPGRGHVPLSLGRCCSG